jgi:hypothetical protein
VPRSWRHSLGTLDGASHSSIEAHLGHCRACQLQALTSPGDTLVELLRRAHCRSAGPSGTFAEGAVTTPAPLGTPAAPDGIEATASVPEELTRHERYRVLRLLGQGGMGAVYVAEHRVMQRPVALKVIRHAFTASPAAVERFRREVRAAARLSHPNIVTAYDAENAGETHFLVMEYVEGVSLAQVVRERGPLPMAEACDYVRQAAHLPAPHARLLPLPAVPAHCHR